MILVNLEHNVNKSTCHEECSNFQRMIINKETHTNVHFETIFCIFLVKYSELYR